MAALPYIQLYVSDYLADAAHLSTLEHGAYLLLIMTYWQRGEPLPDNNKRLAKITRLTESEWLEIRDELSDFFQLRDGLWIHKRIDTELKKVNEKSTSARDAGKASARKRKQKKTTKTDNYNERPADVEQTLNHTDTDTDTDKTLKPSLGALKEIHIENFGEIGMTPTHLSVLCRWVDEGRTTEQIRSAYEQTAGSKGNGAARWKWIMEIIDGDRASPQKATEKMSQTDKGLAVLDEMTRRVIDEESPGVAGSGNFNRNQKALPSQASRGAGSTKSAGVGGGMGKVVDATFIPPDRGG